MLPRRDSTSGSNHESELRWLGAGALVGTLLLGCGSMGAVDEVASGPLELASGARSVSALSLDLRYAELSHACMANGGRLVCRGDNELGQVDYRHPSETRRELRLTELEGVTDVAVTSSTTCVIEDHGSTLTCWGCLWPGACWRGPTRSHLRGDQYVAVRGGRTFACALTRAGKVRCYSAGTAGPDGQPALLELPVASAEALAATGFELCVLADGQLACSNGDALGTLRPVPCARDVRALAGGFEGVFFVAGPERRLVRLDFGDPVFGRGDVACRSTGFDGVESVGVGLSHMCFESGSRVMCSGGVAWLYSLEVLHADQEAYEECRERDGAGSRCERIERYVESPITVYEGRIDRLIVSGRSTCVVADDHWRCGGPILDLIGGTAGVDDAWEWH